MKIEILIVEDDPVWRTMLTRFINNEPDLVVIHSVDSKEEALAFCSNNKADVVLMDLNLTDNNLDGIQATLGLSMMGNTAKVIALTSLEDEHIIIDTYTAGAVQYVSKSNFRSIPDVIRAVHKTNSPQEILVREYLRLKKDEQYSKLTVAEKEIVLLSEEGNVRSILIDKLGKSEGTLKNQITSILRKFKARTLKDVVRMIKSRGLSDKELDQ